MTYLAFYWIVAGFATLWLPRGGMSMVENFFVSFLLGGVVVPARIILKVIQ